MIEKIGISSSFLTSTASLQPGQMENKQPEFHNTTTNNQQQVQPYLKDEEKEKESIGNVIHSVNEFLGASSTHLKFEFHEKLKEYYVTVVSNENNEVIREIPAKKMLDIYAAMTEFLGLMVDKKI
jgi:flagellar protein FlaG